MQTDRYGITLMEPTFEPWRPAGGGNRAVAVLMSGGVDSSIAAHLLRQAGWDVVGVTMKIPTTCNGQKRSCCGNTAAFVCHEMSLPHYFVDVTKAFEHLIIEPFRRSYANAQTPNPCVDCNTLLKFSLVWDIIQEQLGIDHCATGHYARIMTSDSENAGSRSNGGCGRARLARAVDKSKDQSYFLYGIDAARLSRFLLPLGEYTKPQIRAIAAGAGLSVAEKAESMELCFAGQCDYRTALSTEELDRPGQLLDVEGATIGTHRGISNYTIGQRRGLGHAGGEPLYVIAIDASANTVTLGDRAQSGKKTIVADKVNILIHESCQAGAALSAKIRSYGDPRPCRLLAADADGMTVEFAEPIFAPSPGQRLVLYDDNDCVVAGGVITAGM